MHERSKSKEKPNLIVKYDSNLLDHLLEGLLLVLPELLVVLHALNIKLVLGLGLWGLKWAGEDCNFNILNMIQ